MRFTISSTVLAKALQTVSRTIQKRNTIPILSNIVLEAEGRCLAVRATDLDIEVSLEIEANVEEAGGVTVGGHLFADIVRKMSGDVSFKYDKSDKDLAVVSAGRSRFSLQTLPTEDYPSLQVGEFSHAFDMPSADLARLFKKVAFAISTEETRYFLNGVFFHVVEIGYDYALRAVATDGHRLAQAECTAPRGSEEMPSVIVPRKTVGEVDKILEYGETVRVEVSESKVRFSCGNATLTSKNIDGTYPDYQRVVPLKNNKKAISERLAFASSVDRVSTLASERGRAVKLTLDAGSVDFLVINPDRGEATEQMPIDYDAERLEIGFNAQYVNDILQNCDCEQVEMYLEDGGSPCLFRPVGDAKTLYVLMPMRI